ncbi:hypothetical protein MLD38_010074 [Melastoma candidum]|uniref:Uncharacterized protein n=1 Tax=Melastoma candidum TaxID=119954 RepID=A0ACB9QYN9_9MYRT|nr:hypothetical protein MLD38_010074 [Melastoma candidum]
MGIVEMQVHMDCTGCENKIRKALQRVEGVDDVDIDMAMQKVTVTGWTDRDRVLQTVRKTGRRAEFWPFPFVNPEYHILGAQHYYYLDQFGPPRVLGENGSNGHPISSYNYYRHGYGGSEYGYMICSSLVLDYLHL